MPEFTEVTSRAAAHHHEYKRSATILVATGREDAGAPFKEER